MKDNWFETHRHNRHRNERSEAPQQPSQDSQRLLTTLGVAAVGLFLASGLEPPFVAAMFREFLIFASLGFVAVAVFRRDAGNAARVTAWDQAAILLLIGLVASLFVDPAAVQQALVDRGLIETPAAAPVSGN